MIASVSASEATEIESLLTRADEALYVAKARGRNRIEMADCYGERPRGTARSGLDVAPPPLAEVASPSVLPAAHGEGVAVSMGPVAASRRDCPKRGSRELSR